MSWDSVITGLITAPIGFIARYLYERIGKVEILGYKAILLYREKSHLRFFNKISFECQFSNTTRVKKLIKFSEVILFNGSNETPLIFEGTGVTPAFVLEPLNAETKIYMFNMAMDKDRSLYFDNSNLYLTLKYSAGNNVYVIHIQNSDLHFQSLELPTHF